MEGYYFSVQTGEKRSLCVAPLTDRRLSLSGQDIQDQSGYFLYELIGDGDNAEVNVIAQLTSQEAAFQLREILKMN